MKLPPYDTFPMITNGKISLRQIQPSDMNDLIEISFYDALQAKTLKQAKEMLAKIEEDYFNGNSIHWGIADETTDKVVGTCGYYRGLEKGEGELGCILLPQHRGKGYMTQALQLAIDFGLSSIELKRIWALTTRQNNKAIKLLERLNFIKIEDLENDEVEYELRQGLNLTDAKNTYC